MPTIAAVNSEPIARNSELGYYTNFVNFFDLAALSIPTSVRSDGLPAGITLIGKCGSDHLLAAAGVDAGGAVARRALSRPDPREPLSRREPVRRIA